MRKSFSNSKAFNYRDFSDLRDIWARQWRGHIPSLQSDIKIPDEQQPGLITFL